MFGLLVLLINDSILFIIKWNLFYLVENYRRNEYNVVVSLIKKIFESILGLFDVLGNILFFFIKLYRN